MRIWLVILLLWAFGALLPARAARWVPHRLGGVTIFVHPGEEQLAAEIGGMAADELPRVAAALGVEKPRPFPIYAYANYVEFLRETGLDPDLLGESASPSGTIKLDVNANVNVETVRRTLAHELTHSLLDQRLGDRIGWLPLWVNEGLAVHLSDPLTPAQLPATAQLIHRNGVLSLDELDSAFTRGHARDAAYLQSRSMIAWLDYHYPGAIRRLIDGMAGGSTFAEALHAATGLTPDTWWQQWQASVPAIAYWLLLLGSPVWYAPLAVLLMIIAIARILRKRAEAKQEAEEAIEEEVVEGEAAEEEEQVEE